MNVISKPRRGEAETPYVLFPDRGEKVVCMGVKGGFTGSAPLKRALFCRFRDAFCASEKMLAVTAELFSFLPKKNTRLRRIV